MCVGSVKMPKVNRTQLCARRLKLGCAPQEAMLQVNRLGNEIRRIKQNYQTVFQNAIETLATDVYMSCPKKDIDYDAMVLMKLEYIKNHDLDEQKYAEVFISNQEAEVRGWLVNAYLCKIFADNRFQMAFLDMHISVNKISVFLDELPADFNDVFQARTDHALGIKVDPITHKKIIRPYFYHVKQR